MIPTSAPEEAAVFPDHVGWPIICVPLVTLVRSVFKAAAAPASVIAHPARYKFTPNEEFALFTEFKGLGGQGVEVVTGSHSAAEYLVYADTAREFGLVASRGSDFHSPLESHTELGTLPYLSAELTPVWELLQQRIQ